VATLFSSPGLELRFQSRFAALADVDCEFLPGTLSITFNMQSRNACHDLINAPEKMLFIVTSYGDATQLYYKGHTLAQAQEIERFLRSNNLDAAYQTFQNERALIETATFSSNPPGRFWIAATTKPGVFVIDFVFFKLWPVLLIAVLVSLAIAGVAYRFVRNRHAEVMAERGRLNDFAESSSD
jgi:hypothetical protein